MNRLRLLTFSHLSFQRRDWLNTSIVEEPVSLLERLRSLRGQGNIHVYKTNEDELPIEFLVHVSNLFHKALLEKGYGRTDRFAQIRAMGARFRVRMPSSTSFTLRLELYDDSMLNFDSSLQGIRRVLTRDEIKQIVLQVLRDADNKEIVRSYSLCTLQRCLINPSPERISQGIYGSSFLSGGDSYLRESVYTKYVVRQGVFCIQGIPFASVVFKKEKLFQFLCNLIDLKVDNASFKGFLKLKINKNFYRNSVKRSAADLDTIYELIYATFAIPKEDLDIEFVEEEDFNITLINISSLSASDVFMRLPLLPFGKYRTNQDVKNNTDFQKVVNNTLTVLRDCIVKYHPEYKDYENLPNHDYFLPAPVVVTPAEGVPVSEGLVTEMSPEEEAEALSFLAEVEEQVPINNEIVSERALSQASESVSDRLTTARYVSIIGDSLSSAFQLTGIRRSSYRTLTEQFARTSFNHIPVVLNILSQHHLQEAFGAMHPRIERVIRIEAHALGVLGVLNLHSLPGVARLNQESDSEALLNAFDRAFEGDNVTLNSILTLLYDEGILFTPHMEVTVETSAAAEEPVTAELPAAVAPGAAIPNSELQI